MRKHKPKPRVLAADPRYNDTMVTRFVNNLMWDGKKSVAFGIFYDALDIVKNRTNEDELQIWKKALNNVMPQVEVRSRRVGGSTFQIPTELPANRKISIGIKWMIKYARARSAKDVGKVKWKGNCLQDAALEFGTQVVGIQAIRKLGSG